MVPERLQQPAPWRSSVNRGMPAEQIRKRLGTMTLAKQVCEDLLRDALDAGGSDNIAVIVGRAVAKDAV
jgi:hypothetical protein